MRPIEIAYKEHGYDGVVEFLKHNHNVVFEELFSAAAARNDRATIDLILPYSDPRYNQSIALRRAVNNAHYEMVEFLIPFSDCMAMRCSPLLRAVEKHDLKMVELLLPHSDPKLRRSEFLQRCIYHDLKDIARLLWPVSNIDVIRRDFVKQDSDHARLQLHKMELWEPEFQRDLLLQSIGEASHPSRKTKM